MGIEDVLHAQTGRAFFRDGAPDLADDVELWRQVWASTRSELMADWIARHPGSRCAAWWRFDAKHVARLEGESEVECLHRNHLLDRGELEAIRRKAVSLARYNAGRRPDRREDNYIKADELCEFAARIGLLGNEERAILGLDHRGEGIRYDDESND
jgi:hypothetical protein